MKWVGTEIPLIWDTCQRSLICFSFKCPSQPLQEQESRCGCSLSKDILGTLSGSVFHFFPHLQFFPLIYFNVNRYTKTWIFNTVWLCELNSIFAICWNQREVQNCREFIVFKTFSCEETLFSWSLNRTKQKKQKEVQWLFQGLQF